MDEQLRREDDPTAVAAARRVTELQGQLADARARSATPFGIQVVETRERREAREQAMALEPELAAAVRDHEVAVASARARIAAARRPGREALLRRLGAASAAAIEAAVALREHDVATAAAAGVAPGPAPIPGLAMVAEQVARLRAQFDDSGRRDDGPAPVPRGKQRVRLLTKFLDRSIGQYYGPGDVTDIDKRDVRDLLQRRVVELVE